MADLKPGSDSGAGGGGGVALHSVKELIELALIYAIQDREAMADAAAQDPEGPKAAALAREFEALLKRRYGRETEQHRTAHLPSVSIFELLQTTPIKASPVDDATGGGR